MLSSIDANATRLERHDLASGNRTVLAGDEAYDVGGVWLDPATLEPQAVEFERDRQEIVLLDESLQADLDRLHALGEGDLGVGRRERGDRWWMVSLSPSDGPVRYFVYDRSTGEARYLFPHRAELEGLPLAPMEPFTFTARDGIPVHGYLTFPPGVERRTLPAVLDVHGGPWARDTWGFNSEAQWLANRGYVCIQVNFRSLDGVRQGVPQRRRQAVGRCHAGRPHGRRRARGGPGLGGPRPGGHLRRVVRRVCRARRRRLHPDVYRCGVDIVGPSNLLTLLASVPGYSRP